jgi:opacity protein-like surface antigen
MKSVITIILAVVAFATAAFAQQTPQPTEQLVRIQSEVATGDVQAFFEKSVTVNGTVFRLPWESVSWNASEKTVTVNGVTLTYGQVMAFVVAIAQKERQEQLNPPPAPDPQPSA